MRGDEAPEFLEASGGRRGEGLGGVAEDAGDQMGSEGGGGGGGREQALKDFLAEDAQLEVDSLQVILGLKF